MAPLIPLAQLWLPILLAAVAVWMASAFAWMALPHHKNDYSKLPDEDGFTAAVKSLGIGPGNYGFPYCGDHKNMKDPELQRKWKEGPTGWMTVMKPNMSMGKNMLITFVVYVVVSVLIGYLASVTVAPGSGFVRVFQVAGTAGVLAYSFAFIPGGVWFGQKPRAIAFGVIDGVVYGLISGAIFAGLWPGG